MPNENNKILKYNPGKKSMKTHYNSKKSSTTKINRHTASLWLFFIYSMLI